jgi:hypothetical protein
LPPKLQGPAGSGVGHPDDLTSSNAFIEAELTRKLQGLAEYLEGDALTVACPMRTPVDDLVRDAVEDIQDKKSKLFVILETDGGSIEVVERIAHVLRHHYPNEISFIVPNFAMSAGTVLVMCGDKIYMDYFSVLGPIDPQVASRTKGDMWVPALGYLEKYQEFVDKSARGELTAAELALMIEKFDPAELHQFEQARDHSVELLKKWLRTYKFKNWERTHTRNKRVTDEMKSTRAEEIAVKLNEVSKWKSHSRGLSMQVIAQELNLQIDDFGKDEELRRRIRSYYRLLYDYMLRTRQTYVIHTPGNYLGFL